MISTGLARFICFPCLIYSEVSRCLLLSAYFHSVFPFTFVSREILVLTLVRANTTGHESLNLFLGLDFLEFAQHTMVFEFSKVIF